MGIYIHGKMPMNGEVIVIRPNGQATLYARGDVAFLDDPKRIYKTVELQPHGRLGDLDALRRAMYHEAFETDTPMQKWDSGCWIRYKLFERMEEAAPTIIPADLEGGTDG